MDPTTNEPRVDIIVAMIDLVFNALSVINNLIVDQLSDAFTEFFNYLFGLIP